MYGYVERGWSSTRHTRRSDTHGPGTHGPGTHGPGTHGPGTHGSIGES